MNQSIKNILGGTVVVVILVFGYSIISYVNFYGKSIQPSSFRSFSVTGEGKVTAIPDVAEFSFQVVTQGGKDIVSLQETNTSAMNRAISFIKSEGVEDKDIKTRYYSVDPRYESYDCRPTPYGAPISEGGLPAPAIKPCPPPSIVGYTINQSVQVKIRDFKKIGDILSGIVINGANQVGALSFTLDDPSKPQNQARTEAVEKAKAKAEAVAKAGGFNLGRLLGIQEGYNPYPIYQSYGKGGVAIESAATPSPTIQPGSEEINVNVTLLYEIE